MSERQSIVVEGLTIEYDDPAELESPEVQQAIGEAREAVRANPLLAYVPHEKQKPFHVARTKIKVFIGGNRSGKSTAGITDDLIQILPWSFVPEHLRDFKIWEGDFFCRIVVPDYGRPFRAVLETTQKWVPPGALMGGGWEKAFKEREHCLYFADGNFIEFMTLEQDVSKFGGSARHRVHFDEEPTGEKGERIRYECVERLTDYHGDELFTFSAVSGGLGWTYDELFEKRGEEVMPQVFINSRMTLVQAHQDDNPHLSQAGKDENLEKLPEAEREARRAGNYVHYKGLVYPMFDMGLHVIDELDPKDVHDLFVVDDNQYDGIDPGMQTTAILFGGFDKDNRLAIFDELYLSGRWAIPEFAAEAIREKRKKWKLPERPRYTLIDPSARNRSLTDGDSVQAAYWRADVRTIHANNSREAGVFEVMRRMEHRSSEGDPRPLVAITRNCKNLIKEVQRYRRDDREDGTFDVVKRDDHGCDVLRYIAQAKPLPTPRRKDELLERHWVPGTAPPFRAKQKEREHGPLGIYT